MLEIEKILKIITDFSISFNYSPYYYIIPRQFLKFLNSIKIRKKNGNSTEYLFSKSSNYYTCYRKTVIIRRGKKSTRHNRRNHSQKCKGESFIKRKKGQAARSKLRNKPRKEQIQHGGGRDVNVDKSSVPLSFSMSTQLIGTAARATLVSGWRKNPSIPACLHFTLSM